MILEVLKKRCLQSSEDVDALLVLLRTAKVPLELRSYQKLVIDLCEYAAETINKNMVNIRLNKNEILEDILSDVQQSTMLVKLISDRFSVPVLRAMPFDRLCMSILNWLHSTHVKTRNSPPAVSDGSISVWPLYPQVYMFPQLEKRSLLYQPLLFHEFGHVLYVLHKPEMDSLVTELQGTVTDLILPRSQRNDRHSEIQAERRQIIVDTWYRWIQELYCDAVGFQIGGPSYLYAFSTYLSIANRNEFYRNPKDLQLSNHPVTWLRVHFLTESARQANHQEVAHTIEDEWSTFACAMGIREDYHGFYDKSLESVVKNTVQDMLIESDPRKCTANEIAGQGWNIGDSPVRLLNWAWQVKLKENSSYRNWEKTQIERYLKHTSFRVQLDDLDHSKDFSLQSTYS